MKNPIERIRDSQPAFSKTQSRIATQILEAGETVSYLSLVELSELAHVTPVTVLNFCKKIGYASFTDFKKEFQAYFQTVHTPRRVINSIDSYQNTEEIELVRCAMEHELQLVSKTFEALNRETVAQAADMLCKADHIFLVGKGLSIPVIDLFLSRLDFLSLDARRISLDNLFLLPNRLVNAGENDVFVIFSFPNYSQEIAEIAKCVRGELGSKIICVTDKATAPLAGYADLLLLCQTSSLVYYNSISAPISLITVLTSLMASKMADKDEEKKKKLKNISYLRANS